MPSNAEQIKQNTAHTAHRPTKSGTPQHTTAQRKAMASNGKQLYGMALNGKQWPQMASE